MAKAVKLSKKTKRLLFSAILTLLVIFVSGFVDVDTNQNIINTPVQPGYYSVVEVQDGDTITIDMDGREEKIRLIGVDTPETVKPNSPVECYGQEASMHLKDLLQNQSVKLEVDPINQNRDRYERLLRYVYYNDQLVNKKIIQEGYGFAYLSFPFSKAEEFRQAQVEARQAGKGIWGGSCQIKEPDGERPKTNELT